MVLVGREHGVNQVFTGVHGVHSTFGQRSFKFHGASLWNELPKYLKDIQSVKKFKELLKLHLSS